MAKLSKLVNQSITDPRKEGLPCFNVFWSNGSGYSSRVFNSSFQNRTSAYGSYSTSNGSYPAGMASDASFGYSGDFANNNSQLSSQAVSSSNWYQSLHNHDQYPVGMSVTSTPTGMLHGTPPNRSQGKANYGYNMINQVLPEGVRPRRYFTYINGYMREHAGTAGGEGYFDVWNVAGNSAVETTYSQSNGSAGYNERTKTLVTTDGSTANELSINVYQSTVDLNSCYSIGTFFTNATVTGFKIAHTYQVENRYDRCVVVGDNGKVVIADRNSNNLQGIIFDINDETPTPVSLSGVTGTTSYGLNSGPQYYTKMQLSWDGKWAFVYQPYYYYGGGVCGYIISTEDPERYFTVQKTLTSGGGAIMPIGESGFVYFNGQNTDSTGMYYYMWDLAQTETTGTGSTRMAYDNTMNLNIANGSEVGATSTVRESGLHGGYYTTCYPRIVTVDWWPINGKLAYEGAVK